MTTTTTGVKAKATRYPLQLEIAAVFTLLITVLGLSLVWYNYNENKKIALIAANDMFERIYELSAANIHRLYSPAEALVDLTSQLEIAESTANADRQSLLNYFMESLRLAPHISSIYVGYDNGELFLVRAIRGDESIRESLNAPKQANFVVNQIQVQDVGKPQQTYFYYTQDGALLYNSDPSQTEFDPRQRRWYQLAEKTDKQVTSGFYIFHSTQEAGTTVAQRTPNGRAVVGADITLQELSTGFAQQKATPSSMILAFNAEGILVAKNADLQLKKTEDDPLQQSHLTQLGNNAITELYKLYQSGITDGQLSFTKANKTWIGYISQLPIRSGRDVNLAILAPQDELLTDIIKVRNQSLFISFALLLVAVIAAWAIARKVSQSLRTLAGEAERIREFRLDTPFSIRSRIIEVDDLASTMTLMKSSIQQFIEISKALSGEKDFDRLLEKILLEASKVCNADGGSILLYDDEKQLVNVSFAYNSRIGMHYGGTSKNEVPFAEISLEQAQDNSANSIERDVVIRGNTVVIDELAQDSRFNESNVRERYNKAEYQCHSLLCLPLRNRQGEIIGALELVNARNRIDDSIIDFKPEIVSYVEALSSQAAISLDNRRLLKAQKDLLDSFIQLIAGAIDAKSPYTSGHCKRVPELARMLAKAAHNSDSGPFKSFNLSDDEWYELHIASWLHDCGKVTTPEYVVDKATKLETVYNRLHEVRMRFEVLWRDVQIEHYKKLAGETDNSAELEATLTQLQEDFAFVAECNVGGEFMAPERIERLNQIGSQTWLRNFDDRTGLSYDELMRKQREPVKPLPAQEYLLADKQEHIVPRNDDGKPFGDNPYGFRMDVPENAYNYGELYNLSVARGTLSPEDRFKINEHITQTIILLNKLPFPKELRRVPTWAGNHHETLVGSGYPRKLSAEDLSIPERIMAITDIFEALTASDRPYKKAKTLSESLRIMSFMRNDGHICPQLFDLFLSSKVFQDYGEQFLSADQIDEVDVTQFMAKKGS